MADVVVCGILVEHGRVLLCHRSPQRRWFPDVWDLPGGHVERGESPPEALCRELAEELGIVVAVDSLTSPVTMSWSQPHVELTAWVVTSWSGVPTNCEPEEHDQLGWFDRTALVTLDLVDASYEAWLSGLLDAQPVENDTADLEARKSAEPE